MNWKWIVVIVLIIAGLITVIALDEVRSAECNQDCDQACVELGMQYGRCDSYDKSGESCVCGIDRPPKGYNEN